MQGESNQMKNDLLIMSSLRQDARQTLTKMSRRIKIPISTIYDRLKHHERGLITKHTTLLDFSKLGYATRATVMLKVPREQREAVRDFLQKSACVNTLMKINNDFDFFFEAVFRQICELEAFIERLEEEFKVRTTKVFYIIEELKREGFLSDPMQVGMPGGVGAEQG